MKYLLLLFFILPNFSFSQTLSGIGDLKVGISVNDLISKNHFTKVILCSIDKLPKKSKNYISSDFDLSSDDATHLIEIDSSCTDLPPSLDYYYFYKLKGCPNAKFYYLKNYNISIVHLTGIYFMSLNDTISVVDIALPDRDLLTALIDKYPPTKNISKIDSLNCRFVLTGVDNIKTSYFENTTWENNISYAESLKKTVFDNNCEVSQTFNYLRFLYTPVKNQIESFVNSYEDRVKKMNTKSIKSISDKL